MKAFKKHKQLNKATLGDNIELTRQDLICAMPMSQYNLCQLMEDSQHVGQTFPTCNSNQSTDI